MTQAWIRRALLSLLLSSWLAAGCSGSGNDALKTNNIGRADSAVVTDDDAGEGEPVDDDDAGSSSSDDLDGALGEQDAGDFDAIISVEIADASAAPDTTVVVETALCGNGQMDPGEDCDKGAENSDTLAGGCRTNCRLAHCGDGVQDEGEACDQGALNSDSEANACRSNCTTARCGDNVVDQNEQCDSGDARSNTAAGACRNDCKSARCGDGVVDNDEGCDDANSVDNDACRNNCRTLLCGNMVIDPGEECDDGNTNSGDGCQATCRTPRCGDRVMDRGEECDDGNTVENDGCRSNCRNGCANDAACSDGLFCTGTERCVNGVCNPGTGVNPDDGVDCTDDVCREDLDRVTHTPNNGRCDVPDPTCNGGRGTSTTATCNATRGCVLRQTSTDCVDTLSMCEQRGDGSYTLVTFAPSCEDNSSCGDPNQSTRACAHIPPSCSTDRVFTSRATATCNATSESCGNNAPTLTDCKTRDSASCAPGNGSFTRVTGTCGANGCGSSSATSACSDPADTCSNAVRHTYEPSCNAASGCGAATQTDTACTARGASCTTDANQTAAVQRYRAECDSNNPGQCVNGGTALGLETCRGRGLVCETVAGVGPAVVNYAASCANASCVNGGSAQGRPSPCSAQGSTCGPIPNGPRGGLQQIVYTAACQDGSSCYPNGRPDTTVCSADAPKCEVDGQGRALRTTYSAACNANNTACAQTANPSYCDQEPTVCNANGQPVDTENKCSGTGCVQTTGATCPTNQRWVCSSSTLRRLQQGGCMYGVGCTYTDTATAQNCAAPQCFPAIDRGGLPYSCGGCGVNSDGTAVCRDLQTCTSCTNGCNDSTGLCNRVIVVPPGIGGVITQGGVLAPGDTLAPGAVIR